MIWSEASAVQAGWPDAALLTSITSGSAGKIDASTDKRLALGRDAAPEALRAALQAHLGCTLMGGCPVSESQQP